MDDLGVNSGRERSIDWVAASFRAECAFLSLELAESFETAIKIS
jgi:hypothetical protein